MVIFLVAAGMALGLAAGDGRAADSSPRASALDRIGALEGVSRWLKDRFSPEELAAMRPDDLQVESHSCSCFDRPRPHFPHRLIVFKTPRGDLVTRAEGQELSVSIKPLAVRTGSEYCSLEDDGLCYGTFDDPCEFTDSRYGPQLEPFFPNCKTTESHPVSAGHAQRAP